MKILIFWDLFWRIWRAALSKELPFLKDKYKPDFVIVNGENMSSGRWPIEKHLVEMEKVWIDLFTSWDHIFDNLDKIKDYLEKTDSKLIRPANYYESKYYKVPWKWFKVLEKEGKKLLVINLLSEIFTRDNLFNPYLKVEEILESFTYEKFDWIIIDFHKEVSSDWYWMTHFLDWKVSFIYWTHTHVQTNDDEIFPNGTWLISDVWMVWARFSVIWSDFESLKKRFLSGINKWKIEQSLNSEYVVNGVCVEIWENMKCKSIEKLRIFGRI